MVTVLDGDCAGSAVTVFTAADARGYQDVTCACGRRFNVRIVRSRNGVALIAPTATVPRHRAAAPERTDP